MMNIMRKVKRKIEIKRAIETVKEKGIDTDLQLYDVIEQTPGQSVYALANLMNWSKGKTYASARRLEKADMVHIQKTMRNNREVLTVKVRSWEEYYTPDELAEMQRPEFMDEVEAIVQNQARPRMEQVSVERLRVKMEETELHYGSAGEEVLTGVYRPLKVMGNEELRKTNYSEF